MPDFCVECGYKCIKPCPAGALPGDGAVDHYKCMVMYPQKVSPEKAVDVFKKRYGYPELQLAGRMMAFTDNAPHMLRHLHHPVSHGRCEARQGEGERRRQRSTTSSSAIT